jgi:hypothetical protein
MIWPSSTSHRVACPACASAAGTGERNEVESKGLRTSEKVSHRRKRECTNLRWSDLAVRLSQDSNIDSMNLTDGAEGRRYIVNNRQGLLWLGTLASVRTCRQDDAESRKESI